MRRIPLRVAANLIWLVIFSVAVIVGAFVTYASGVVFDDSYRVHVRCRRPAACCRARR
jgi:hypothetical protein